MSYQSDLLDPRWQRRRLEIFQRDDFECVRCGASDRPLVVHHRSYHLRPWDAPDFDLETLCDVHHKAEHRKREGLPSVAALRRMIEHAHACRNWDEVWRLCHLFEVEE